MSKFKLTILIAVLLTIPLCGYFIVNGYWWLFDGNNLNQDKMFISFTGGSLALFANYVVYLTEDGKL